MINTVLPRLVPLITKADGLTGLIDIFSGMGGVADWSAKFPVSARPLKVAAGLGSHVGGGVAEPRLRAEQQRRLAALRLVVRRPELRPVPPEQ